MAKANAPSDGWQPRPDEVTVEAHRIGKSPVTQRVALRRKSRGPKIVLSAGTTA